MDSIERFQMPLLRVTRLLAVAGLLVSVALGTVAAFAADSVCTGQAAESGHDAQGNPTGWANGTFDCGAPPTTCPGTPPETCSAGTFDSGSSQEGGNTRHWTKAKCTCPSGAGATGCFAIWYVEWLTDPQGQELPGSRTSTMTCNQNPPPCTGSELCKFAQVAGRNQPSQYWTCRCQAPPPSGG